MDGGHSLPLRVKGQLPDPFIFPVQGLLVISKLRCQIQKCKLCRISQPAFTDLGIIAEHTAFQKQIRICREKVFCRNRRPVYITLLYGHLISGQCAGLVRTDHIDCAQGLHRGQSSYDGSHLYHPGHAQRQNDRYDCRKSFRHSRYRKGDCRKEHVPYISFLKDCHQKQKNADAHGKNAEQLSKLCQSLLKRGQFSLFSSDHPCNPADLRFHSGCSYNTFSPSAGNHGGHKGHVGLVSNAPILHEGKRLLFHRNRLSGQGRLFYL